MTATEASLLNVLGMSSVNLNASEAAVQEFRQLFDSPVREQQLRVLAAVFGKTMPPLEEIEEDRDVVWRLGATEVSALA